MCLGPELLIGAQIAGSVVGGLSDASATANQGYIQSQNAYSQSASTAVQQYQAEAAQAGAEGSAQAALAAAAAEEAAIVREQEIYALQVDLREKKAEEDIANISREADQIQVDARKLLGKQITGYSKGGVKLTSASVQAVLGETVDNAEADYLTKMHSATLARESADIEVRSLQTAAANSLAAGQNRVATHQTNAETHTLLAEKHYQSALAYNRSAHAQYNAAGQISDNANDQAGTQALGAVLGGAGRAAGAFG